MRILRLVDDGDFAVEFHPYITVVRDATPDQRAAIVAAFERAAVGRATGLAGLIEVHGVVLDLDEASLDLLELGDGAVDVRVRPSDLPGSVTSSVGRRVEEAERRLESLEQPHRDRLVVLAEAEARLEAAERAEHGAEPPLDPVDRDDLLADLRAALALHELDDPTPVRDTLDEVRLARSTGELVPSAEALSLADRIDALDREIGQADSAQEPPSSRTLEEAAEQVERARLVLAELELQEDAGEAVDDVAALEAVHAEVEAARDALEGRFGRGRAQRRLDDALVREQDLLVRLGLRSYTEYLTRGGATDPTSSVAGGAVAVARREVERAEATALDLEARVDAALAHAERVEERRRLRDEARALLDAPDLDDGVLTAALVDLRVPATGGGPTDELVDALDAVGLPVRGLDLTDHELETMASDWLAERQHTAARLRRRIEELESETASADEAREAVADAAAAVDVGQVDYAAAVEELAGLRQTAADLGEVTPPVEEIEWYLLARLAGQRQQSFVGSLPLVVDGALDLVVDDEGLTHLLDRLERMAGAVQIVHLTDDPRIAAWAAGLEDDRGAVVRPVGAREE